MKCNYVTIYLYLAKTKHERDCSQDGLSSLVGRYESVCGTQLLRRVKRISVLAVVDASVFFFLALS